MRKGDVSTIVDTLMAVAVVYTLVDTRGLKMHVQSKIQKWGNSSAVRLPAKVLAASGIMADSEIDIQVSKGRLVIQLLETTNEQLFDKLFTGESEAEELLSFVQARLTDAISKTDEAARAVEASREELGRHK